MFDICVLPSSELGPDRQRLGRITAGDFTERFACYPTIASVEKYPRIWKEQLRLLINGQSAVALIHDPRFAWIIYRDGNSCHVQQRLALDGCFEPIPPREVVSEDGDRISEWPVDLESVAQFVAA